MIRILCTVMLTVWIIFLILTCPFLKGCSPINPYEEFVVCINRICEVYTDVDSLEVCKNDWNNDLTDFVLECTTIK
jgi:hypothetical protein